MARLVYAALGRVLTGIPSVLDGQGKHALDGPQSDIHAGLGIRLPIGADVNEMALERFQADRCDVAEAARLREGNQVGPVKALHVHCGRPVPVGRGPLEVEHLEVIHRGVSFAARQPLRVLPVVGNKRLSNTASLLIVVRFQAPALQHAVQPVAPVPRLAPLLELSFGDTYGGTVRILCAKVNTEIKYRLTALL